VPRVIVSASLGLSELLTRPEVYHRNGGAAEHPPTTIVMDRRPVARRITPTTFFRAPANLAAPPNDTPVAGTVGTLALVLRPDGRTLLLDGQVIPNAVNIDRPGGAMWEPQVLNTLERLIRDHHGQWTPRRALWDEPAERLLPELATSPGIGGV
jgi:hypothetical protein